MGLSVQGKEEEEEEADRKVMGVIRGQSVSILIG